MDQESLRVLCTVNGIHLSDASTAKIYIMKYLIKKIHRFVFYKIMGLESISREEFQHEKENT